MFLFISSTIDQTTYSTAAPVVCRWYKWSDSCKSLLLSKAQPCLTKTDHDRNLFRPKNWTVCMGSRDHICKNWPLEFFDL